MARVKYPYVAIQRRAIESAAFADLNGSSVKLLVIMTRQLTKTNNGHLQATYAYVKHFGISSQHTLTRAIQDLIDHGFIYRTWRGGLERGYSKYAVTWLSITMKNGLILDNFQPCAWLKWQPNKEKSNSPKLKSISCKNGILEGQKGQPEKKIPAPKSALVSVHKWHVG